MKTALGPPPGSATNLPPVKDLTFRVESVKCLVRIVKSMGTWMDQQSKIEESSLSTRSSVVSGSVDIQSVLNGEEGMTTEYELHPESNPELSDAATLEQRRAYKLEIQVYLLVYQSEMVINFLVLSTHAESRMFAK